ncbi:MAG: hypothetical protein WCB67_18030, partial [Solirubrobacteraceae bacterium]
MDEADLRLLAFAAEHRLVLAAHAQTLLGISARAAGRRLRVLAEAGLLRSERRLAGLRWYQIDRAGLAAIGSSLSRPRDVDLATYEHDIGLAWLWLAADRGALGATRALVSERQMRSADGRAERFSEPYGVRVPGSGPRGGERRHYPDLVLETASGHRVAIELELGSKSPSRREEILGGYAIDARFDAVLYLVDRPEVGRAIERSAAAVGVSDLVSVQRVAFGPGAGGISRGRTAEAAASRAAGSRAATSG